MKRLLAHASDIDLMYPLNQESLCRSELRKQIFKLLTLCVDTLQRMKA